MDWHRIPSLSALRAFESAARHQSLSHAAKELNVTHAAIAQHVRNLETEFAETLLVRQGRGVVATAAGAALAETLQAGFGRIADGVEDLRRSTENRALNITVTPGFATHWLMPRIGDFWAKHPEVVVNITPSATVMDLRRDGFDLAIRYGNGDWPHLRAEMLTDGDFWVVAHPDLVAGRRVECLQDVADLPWLMEAAMIERQALVAREGLDFDAVALTVLNTNELVLSAVQAGLGVSVQPKSLVERAIKRGDLRLICQLPQVDLGYYIVTVPDRTPDGLRVFLRWLRGQVVSDRGRDPTSRGALPPGPPGVF